MDTMFQSLIISGFTIICGALIFIIMYFHSINEILGNILKELNTLIKKK